MPIGAVNFKDYYAILGVSRAASLADIKKTYRHLARQYHPDLHPDNPEAELRFKEINEAYEILCDPQQRQGYDCNTGPLDPMPTGSKTSPSPQAKRTPNIYEDFVDAIMGQRRYPSGQTPKAGPSNPRTRSPQSPQSPKAPQTSHSSHPSQSEIPIFAVHRAKPQTKAQACDRARITNLLDLEVGVCVTLAEAFRGAQKQVQAEQETLVVQIPPGIRSGDRIRIPGQGKISPTGSQRGDLYLTVELLPHHFFQLEGQQLLCEIPITPDEAALGANIAIPTPDGVVRVTIPPGTRTGYTLRLPGKGWPNEMNQRQDQVVKFQITLSGTLSPIERECYERIRAQRQSHPRINLEQVQL